MFRPVPIRRILLGCVLFSSLLGEAGAREIQLQGVSYDPTRALHEAYDRRFSADRQKMAGDTARTCRYRTAVHGVPR
jgi:ABC-type sulfate transport system substrate-binding protein